MECPKCNIVCRVGKTYYRTVDDDTPDKPTRIFLCHDMVCRNRACSEYNTVVDTLEFEQKNGLQPEPEAENTTTTE